MKVVLAVRSLTSVGPSRRGGFVGAVLPDGASGARRLHVDVADHAMRPGQSDPRVAVRSGRSVSAHAPTREDESGMTAGVT